MSTLSSPDPRVHSENSAASLVSTPDDPGGWVACASDLGHLPRNGEYEAWLKALDLGHYSDEPPAVDDSAFFEPTWEDLAEAAAVLNDPAPPSQTTVDTVRRAFATGGMGLRKGEWPVIRDAYHGTAWADAFGGKPPADIEEKAMRAAAVALESHRATFEAEGGAA